MMYRLNTPAMGIIQVRGCGFAVTLPAGTVFTVDGIPARSSSRPPVEVNCSGKRVRMFPIDIVERAVEVDTTLIFKPRAGKDSGVFRDEPSEGRAQSAINSRTS
jgi:hypothetical protein